MHPQLVAAGFPFPPPGLMPEQLGSDQTRTQDVSVQRADNGVAAAAALQYQNESEFTLISFLQLSRLCTPASVMTINVSI